MSEKTPPVRLDFDRLQAWVSTQLASIQTTMKMMGAVPLQAAGPVLAHPRELRVCTLGLPEVFCQGTRLEFPYQKVQELLLYLIFNPSASKDQLLEDLWDGKSADSVYTAIRQLRRLLKDHLHLAEEAVVKKGRYYSLSAEIQIGLDLHTLDNTVFRGTKIAPQYLCVLMEGLDSSWIEEQRLLFNKTLLARLEQETQHPQLPLERLLVLHLLVLVRDVFQTAALDVVLRLSRDLGFAAVQRAAQQLVHALNEGSSTEFQVAQLRDLAVELLENQRLSAV
ncbi:winged helix-turn-helix domain-containing protein [Deinococcus roseus]|uniref:OmpR/PhoB-type domain-containing protein n=1 Tax=Deinococcus roseus TaxID=392414 RepID=A0ABQ2DG68_9DEIO|nr:hypothetical protein [Deinococcus roseus]GGJ56170.1 hypothetical protein GCM10008938_47900 [Deinococcus roseus]